MLRSTPSRLSCYQVLRVVAVASRTGRYGGPFDTASRQVQALREHGLTARLVAGTYPGDRPDPSQLVPGRYVRVQRLLGAKGFVTTFSSRMALAVAEEVLHAQTVHISFGREPLPLWAALLALATGRSLVLQPHGMLTARTSRLHRVMDRVVVRPLFRRASAVIALGPAERDELEAWNRAPLPPTTVLGNPLPSSVRAATDPRVPQLRVRIVFIARLNPRKRVEDFIAAAAFAQAEGRDWQWHIVGPDDGDGPSARRAAAANPNLEYIGGVPAEAVLEELNRATVFVLPSEREPWGNVLASALAMGIPSVVTRTAALASAIELHGAGRTIPERDPTALLAAVADLLEEQSYRAASAGAIALRQELLEPKVLRLRLVELYRALLR